MSQEFGLDGQLEFLYTPEDVRVAHNFLMKRKYPNCWVDKGPLRFHDLKEVLDSCQVQPSRKLKKYNSLVLWDGVIFSSYCRYPEIPGFSIICNSGGNFAGIMEFSSFYKGVLKCEDMRPFLGVFSEDLQVLVNEFRSGASWESLYDKFHIG